MPPDERLERLRPLLKLSPFEDPLTVKRALLAERQFWSELDEIRIRVMKGHLRPYVSAVRRALARRRVPLPQSHEIRVECADDRKFQVVRAVTEKYRAAGNDVVDIDGARIGFGGSAWGLLRASNTGPVLVMRFEAATDRERDQIRAEVEAAVAEAKEKIA